GTAKAAPTHCPDGVVIRETIPRPNRGALCKSAICAQASRHLAGRGVIRSRIQPSAAPDDKEMDMQTIEQAVIGILAESLTADPSAINTETTMESLNADSLDMVEVVMEIEDTIEREI